MESKLGEIDFKQNHYERLAGELGQLAAKEPKKILEIAFTALSQNNLIVPRWLATSDEGVMLTGIAITDLEPSKEFAEFVTQKVYKKD